MNDDDSPHIANRQAVIAALLAALPNDRTIALRTPLYKQTLYGNGAPFDENDALNNSTAYTGSDLARLAHHNDCFLASDTDFGTYSIDPSTRAMEQSYLAADTRFLPMGGETCALNIPRSDCASEGGAADNELAQFHWSYLNKNYNTDVLSRWDSLSGGPGNCYGAIKRQLGYRFQLIDAHIDASVRQGCDFNFNLRLINQGYAAPYNPRRVDLILENTLTNARYTIAMPNQNPQFWLAQSDYHALYNTDTITINETLGISKDVPAGNYNLYLHLPDPTTHLYEQPAYAIRLANDATWQAATGFNDLQYTIKVIASDCEVPYDGTQYRVPYGCYIGNSLALSTDTLDCNESLEIIQASFSLVNQHIQWVLSDTPISDLSDTNNAILLGTGASLAIANYCDTLALGTYYFTPFIQSDNCGSLGTSTAITFINKRIFKAKVWLQAPYIPSFGAMTNTLQNNNLFPLQQPYNVSPWYYGGTEYVATTNDLPPYTSDWLLIEALDTNNIIQQQRAVFLRNDGQLIDTDGKEGIYFDQLLSNQPYYFIIRHRNHLAIKSNVPLYLNSSTTYDFSNPSNIDNGNTQLASIGFGVYAMYSGDADGNGIISLSDFNTYLSTAGASNTYTIADFNLDGNVTVVDYNDYKPNASIIGITAVRY